MDRRSHFAQRCSQRNIRRADVELMLTYGIEARDRHGGVRVLPPSRYTLDELEREGLSERQRRRIRTLVVIRDRASSAPVTAYYPTRRKMRHSRRMVRNSGKGA